MFLSASTTCKSKTNFVKKQFWIINSCFCYL